MVAAMAMVATLDACDSTCMQTYRLPVEANPETEQRMQHQPFQFDVFLFSESSAGGFVHLGPAGHANRVPFHEHGWRCHTDNTNVAAHHEMLAAMHYARSMQHEAVFLEADSNAAISQVLVTCGSYTQELSILKKGVHRCGQ